MGTPGSGLARGLAITFRAMTRRAHTAQYPDHPPELPPRSRGVIALFEENCTVCMLCARECPDWCIYIDSHKESVQAEGAARARQRNVLDRFAIDFSLCMYCGICIEVCPFDALFWSPEFEYAEYDIRDMTHEKERLREWMWTVPPPPALDPLAEPAKEVTAVEKARAEATTPERETRAPRQPGRSPGPERVPRGDGGTPGSERVPRGDAGTPAPGKGPASREPRTEPATREPREPRPGREPRPDRAPRADAGNGAVPAPAPAPSAHPAPSAEPASAGPASADPAPTGPAPSAHPAPSAGPASAGPAPADPAPAGPAPAGPAPADPAPGTPEPTTPAKPDGTAE